MEIPKLLKPRIDVPIQNSFEFLNSGNLDLHIVIYWISKNKCKIIIRRLDDEGGWENNIQLRLFSLDQSSSQMIHIGKNNQNEKIIKQTTTIDLEKIQFKTQKIPKVIIQTDETTKPRCLLHWNSILTLIELNPEYEYRYYDMSDRREFIKKNFESDVVFAYDSLVPGSFRSDMFRFCYLLIHGGCYMDCKTIARAPLRDMIEPHEDYVLTIDWDVKNTFTGIMIMISGIPELRGCIDSIVENVKKNLFYSDPLDFTGPGLLGKFLNQRFYKKMRHHVVEYDEEDPTKFLFKIGSKTYFQKHYKGYYKNYMVHDCQNTNKLPHYSKLCRAGQVYYKQYTKVGKYIFYLFPNESDDKFKYEIRNNNNVLIRKLNDKSGWNYPFKIKIIDDEKNKDCLIDVEPSNVNMKMIKLPF